MKLPRPSSAASAPASAVPGTCPSHLLVLVHKLCPGSLHCPGLHHLPGPLLVIGRSPVICTQACVRLPLGHLWFWPLPVISLGSVTCLLGSRRLPLSCLWLWPLPVIAPNFVTCLMLSGRPRLQLPPVPLHLPVPVQPTHLHLPARVRPLLTSVRHSRGHSSSQPCSRGHSRSGSSSASRRVASFHKEYRSPLGFVPSQFSTSSAVPLTVDILLYISGSTLITAVGLFLAARLCLLQGPLIRGLAGVHSLGRMVCTFLPKRLPGAVSGSPGSSRHHPCLRSRLPSS